LRDRPRQSRAALLRVPQCIIDWRRNEFCQWITWKDFILTLEARNQTPIPLPPSGIGSLSPDSCRRGRNAVTAELGQNEPCHSLGRHGRSTPVSGPARWRSALPGRATSGRNWAPRNQEVDPRSRAASIAIGSIEPRGRITRAAARDALPPSCGTRAVASLGHHDIHRFAAASAAKVGDCVHSHQLIQGRAYTHATSWLEPDGARVSLAAAPGLASSNSRVRAST
jgi:hypothetical protein